MPDRDHHEEGGKDALVAIKASESGSIAISNPHRLDPTPRSPTAPRGCHARSSSSLRFAAPVTFTLPRSLVTDPMSNFTRSSPLRASARQRRPNVRRPLSSPGTQRPRHHLMMGTAHPLLDIDQNDGTYYSPRRVGAAEVDALVTTTTTIYPMRRKTRGVPKADLGEKPAEHSGDLTNVSDAIHHAGARRSQRRSSRASSLSTQELGAGADRPDLFRRLGDCRGTATADRHP